MMICLWMGKTYTAKNPPGDFKVTTPENSLLSQQAVASKGIPVPYTNLQLNPYPNTQLDLFCSDNLSFQCTTPNIWMQSNILLNQRSKQHFKLSKTSLKKKCQAFRSKTHTHTHTHNKSNQFYISKTS